MTRTLVHYSIPLGVAAVATGVLLWFGARPDGAFGMLVVMAFLLGATLVFLVRTAQSLSGAAPAPLDGPRDLRWAKELTREKALTLRSLRDLEFDHAMGKLSDRDFEDMAGRLRARAVRIMKDLDERPDYVGRIERELDARLARKDEPSGHVCPSCAIENDADAAFCKRCGQRLSTD